MRLPKNSDEEIEIRNMAMQDGLKKAIMSPLSVMRVSNKVWDSLEIAARYGNINSKSDVEVGVRAVEFGIWGSWKNVLINMVNIKDMAWKNNIIAEADEIMANAKKKSEEILQILDNRN